MKIGRFLGGLREELREKLEPIQNLTYDGACNSALVFEKYEKTKPPQGNRFSRPPVSRPFTLELTRVKHPNKVKDLVFSSHKPRIEPLP